MAAESSYLPASKEEYERLKKLVTTTAKSPVNFLYKKSTEPIEKVLEILRENKDFIRYLLSLNNGDVIEFLGQIYHPEVMRFMFVECGLDMKQKVGGKSILLYYLSHLPVFLLVLLPWIGTFAVIAEYGPYDMEEIMEKHNAPLLIFFPSRSLFDFLPPNFPAYKRKTYANYVEEDGNQYLLDILSRYVVLHNDYVKGLETYMNVYMMAERDTHSPKEFKEIKQEYIANFQKIIHEVPVISPDYIRFLFEQGADVNFRSPVFGGFTPLHVVLHLIHGPCDMKKGGCSEEEYENALVFLPFLREIATLLTEFRTDPSITDDSGRSAMQFLDELLTKVTNVLKGPLGKNRKTYLEEVLQTFTKLKKVIRKWAPSCAYCGQKGIQLHLCPQCRKVYYCSDAHREADLPRHQAVCRPYNAPLEPKGPYAIENVDGGARRRLSKRRPSKRRRLSKRHLSRRRR